MHARFQGLRIEASQDKRWILQGIMPIDRRAGLQLRRCPNVALQLGGTCGDSRTYHPHPVIGRVIKVISPQIIDLPAEQINHPNHHHRRKMPDFGDRVGFRWASQHVSNHNSNSTRRVSFIETVLARRVPEWN